MKRKVSAIALLIAFIGLMVHDVIPHHHHLPDYVQHNDTFYSHSHFHDDHHHSHHIVPLDCEASHMETVDHSQDCPHHFHPCLEQVYEPVQNKRISSKESKVLSKWLLPTENSLVIYTLDSAPFLKDSRINCYSFDEFYSLCYRGPPAKC